MGVEFVKCMFRNNSGRLSTPTLCCCAGGCSLQPRHPLSPTAATHQSLISSLRSTSSSSPGHDYHDIISPSLPPKISIVCRARQPPTVDLIPQLPTELSRRRIRPYSIPRCTWSIEVNSELHISFSSCIPHWSSTRGSGDYHMIHSQRHSSLTLPITSCGMLPPPHLRNGCQWHTTFQTAKPGQLLNAASDFLRASISLNARPFYLSDLPGYLSHGSLPLR